MTPNHITTLCRWFRCTESDLFTVAFHAKYGDVGFPSPEEMMEYAEEQVIPRYVRDYLLRVIYPQVCLQGGVR